MKSLITTIGTFGPFTSITTLDDRYRCDGTDYPFAVVGDATEGEFVPPAPVIPPAIVPQTVTRRQALQALIWRGLDDDVDAALAAIPNPIQRKLAQAEFAASQVFERHRPLVISIGAALGLDLDDLFVFADTL